MDNKPSICIVSFPMPSAIVVNTFLNSLLRILCPISKEIYLITSNISIDADIRKKVTLKDIGSYLKYRNPKKPKFISAIFQALNIMYIQIKICYSLITIYKKVDVVLFYIGGSNLFFPVAIAKCLKKRVITSALGLGSMSYKRNSQSRYRSNIFPFVLSLMETFLFSLSDLIIVESDSAIKFLNLEKFKHKIESKGSRFIDTETFKINNPIIYRDPLIGYVGRLEEGKGIVNLIEAIPLVLKSNKSFNFIIVGNGPLYPRVEKLQYTFSNNVRVMGWVSHEEIASLLNKIKFLVLPSYSEGLPTIVLEAMACGSVVLSTPVGAIPDVIFDKKTGFIMINNSPECIADTIMQASNCSHLNDIIINARDVIDNNFMYSQVIENYKKIIGYE